MKLHAILLVAWVAVSLTSCATEPDVTASDDSVRIHPHYEQNTPVTADENRSATGTITSDDGSITGRVEVKLENFTDDQGKISPIATLKFFDLVTPYDYLTPGGALAPRDDDPCFDTGIRSGGGTITPDENGFATTVIPTEDRGYFLHEILLHLDWTQIDPEGEHCLQPVVARAPLNWAE